MEVEMDSCLICTSQFPSSQKLMGENVAVKRERSENGDVQFITADEDDDPPDSASDEEHLTPYFVLKSILKVPTETLDQLNYEEYNNQDPLSQGNNGGQVPLCPPCAELARQFHETFEQVSRLKITLRGIQVEFLDKLQQNQDDQCQASSAIWNQIRRQIVLQYFGDEPEGSETEATENLEEEWHFGETMVKAEVADEPGDDEGDFAVPVFPMSSYSSSTLHYDPTPHLEDDEGINGNLSCGSLVPPPPKTRKTSGSQGVTVFRKKGKRTKDTRKWLQCLNCPYRTVESEAKRMDAHLPLHEEGSQGVPCEDCGWYLAPEKLARHRAYHHSLPRTSQKLIKKTVNPQPPPKLQCTFCPHKTTGITAYKRHQIVHEEGSEATACNGCGIFVLPNSFFAHQAVCASAIRNSLGRDKKLSGTESKGEMVNINESNLGFISFNRTRLKRKVYQCRKCPYETSQLWRMQVHVELHDEGALAVTCGECRWFLPPEQLETHRAVNHSAQELPASVDLEQMPAHPIPQPSVKIKKIPLLFRCDHCPHESKTKLRYDEHLTLHSEESNAVPCPDCHVFYRPSFNKWHLRCGKRKTLKKQRLIKLGANRNDRKLEDNPSQPRNPE